MQPRVRTLTALLALSLTCVSASAEGQSSIDSAASSHGEPLATTATAPALVTSRHGARSIAIIGVATTLLLRPLDEPITDALRTPSMQRSTALSTGADVFNVVGSTGFVIGSAALLGTGYATHNATTTQLGIRTAEALVMNAIVTSVLKGAFGRQRPFVNEETPSVFAAGRGFTTAGRTSFPSGHASSSFAFASAFTTALGAHHPKAARIAGPILYSSATLVGVSRVYGVHHWASDIAAGATIGMLSGWVVTRKDVEIGAGTVRWRF